MRDVKLIRPSDLAATLLQFGLFAATAAVATIASSRVLHTPSPAAGPGTIYLATLGLALAVLMCLLALVPMARLAVFSRTLAVYRGAVLLLRTRNAHGVSFAQRLPWRDTKEAFNGAAGLSLARGETVSEVMLVRGSTLLSLLADGALMALAMATLIFASATMERVPPTSPASAEHVAFEISLALMTVLAAIAPMAKLCIFSAIMARVRGPFLFVRVWSREKRGRTWHVPWSLVEGAFAELPVVLQCEWRVVSVPADGLRSVCLDVSDPAEAKILISWQPQSGDPARANQMIARQFRDVFGNKLEVKE